MQDFTNNQELMIAAGPGDVVRIDGKPLPPILAEAGAQTWQHVVEYFTAHIRNPNTRAAYGRAARSLTIFQPLLPQNQANARPYSSAPQKRTTQGT